MRYVYILRCADDSLYTGITTDLERRLSEHNTDPKGARYTRMRRPVSIARSKECDTKSEAAKVEREIKQMRREEKGRLL